VSTDAPYLTPFNMGRPFPRYNEPQYLPFVYSKIASILGTSINDLVSQVNKVKKKKIFQVEKKNSEFVVSFTNENDTSL
jgi:Tat protein secretion system quality control protein TatD with DNase activity